MHNSNLEIIPNITDTPLSFDTVDFDVDGLYDASHPTQLVAPIAGRYLLMANVAWAGHSNGSCFLEIERNGAVIAATCDAASSQFFTYGPVQTVETIYQLAAGDVIQAAVDQNSGSSLAIYQYPSGTGLAPSTPSLCMSWIAP